MNQKKITIDGKPVIIREGEIDPLTTGVVILNNNDLEDTIKMEKITNKVNLEDTLNNIKMVDVKDE